MKEKMLKMAKVCKITAKVLYLTSCVVCFVCIILAIALSATRAISSLTKVETAVLFWTLAMYAFFCVGLLWNVEGIFKNVEKEKTPFCGGVSYYLKKTAIFTILLSTVPAVLGSVVMKLAQSSSEITFPVSLGGIIAGVVLLLLGIVFKYGTELQKRDDETL